MQTNIKQSWFKPCKAYGEILTCRNEYPNALDCLRDFQQCLQEKFLGLKTAENIP